jgi:lipopolysaccharide export system permease protein
MAREDEWTVWFGMCISTVVLTPVAAFFTYKANNDSTVFNIDLYKNFMMKVFGIRPKRNIYRKEVIIEDPKYPEDAKALETINSEIYQYSKSHKLLHWPNPIKVFFRAGDDQRIEEINNDLEAVIDDLSYSTDKIILAELNNYPVISPDAHTRPFRRKWLNIITGLLLPVGIIMYIRMIRFRLRLYHDLRTVRHTSDRIIAHIYNNKV